MVSDIPMVKNCGSPPKVAKNYEKIAKIAEIAENYGNCGKFEDHLGVIFG